MRTFFFFFLNLGYCTDFLLHLCLCGWDLALECQCNLLHFLELYQVERSIGSSSETLPAKSSMWKALLPPGWGLGCLGSSAFLFAGPMELINLLQCESKRIQVSLGVWWRYCHTPETENSKEHTSRPQIFYLRLLISDEDSLVQDCTDPGSAYQVTHGVTVGEKSANGQV